ncbi:MULTISPECIES: TauD/TfdA family dioxygenase [unclassified Pseudofrankia]|uniref:TauD/TfdA dioxygenase family protein n=1 Tax=unclassified Pseudofrankia TaxID=2994372 RepID=UPI0008DA500E|nr:MULTISPECIES: TauD/TfdA family dioxygenase [unclassified Pseudofrankia]MDT3442228.1 TauD/TfdA family dioxygenase [Pseudofrankia sp. BMG5.37]OHV43563.1 hypothetical protein BCD48_27690 [Pseudofrankia sp. BMG5.36]
MTVTGLAGSVAFERVSGNIGARVHGVELGVKPQTPIADALNSALHEHGVLFFDLGRAIEADELQSFGEVFGRPEAAYAFQKDNSTGVLDNATTPMGEYRTNVWHTDGSALERPPQAALLTAVEVPEAGGDTMWSSMYAAWEALSSRYQRLLDGAEVLHSTFRLPFIKKPAGAVHPAVLRDPVTGRRMLYVNANYTERIVGMGDSESELVLRHLYEHVNTPEFHVRLKWRPGVIAVWEERVTQHRGVADFVGTRRMRRRTVEGDVPVA